MKFRWFLLMVVVVSMTGLVGCKKAETCENFVAKSASCATKKLEGAKLKKVKALVLAFCEAQKADEEMKPFVKMRLACIHQKSCEDFKACTKKAREASRVVRYKRNIKKQKKKIEKLVAEKNWYKAQSRCTYSYSAKKLSEMDDKDGKALATSFYRWCLTNIPVWLGNLRDSGTSKSYFTACGSEKFYKQAGATEKQMAAIKSVCGELKVVSSLARLEKKVDEYKEKGRLHYSCTMKEAAKYEALTSDAGKKMFAKFKKICFQTLGLAVLKKDYDKLKKQKRRYRRYRRLRNRKLYCGYYAKRLLKAYKKWDDLVTEDDDKEMVQFYLKNCRM